MFYGCKCTAVCLPMSGDFYNSFVYINSLYRPNTFQFKVVSTMWDRFFLLAKSNPFCRPVYSVNCEQRRSDQEVIDKMALVNNDVYSCEFGSLKCLLYCGIGGALSCGVTHTLVTPLDVVKCRMQVDPSKYPGILQGFTVTMADEGFKGLTKGWTPTLIGYAMQGTCKFGLYEAFKVYYSDIVGEEISYKWRTSLYLAASASAEIFADILLCPMESVKVRIQTQPDFPSTIRQGVPLIYQNEGLNGFYKGLVPLWCRQIPYTMMKFACFERTLEALYKNVVPKPRSECTKGEQLVVTFAAGYIAGVFCALVSHPADTVVSKLNQADGSTVMKVARQLGFMGLWKGLVARIVMIGTLTAAQWFIYDAVKVWLRLPRPPPPEMPDTLKLKMQQVQKEHTKQVREDLQKPVN